jgi:YegS/Rv2252/BmrU family lipid kinase
VVIVNPISGTGRRPEQARERLAIARAAAAASTIDAQVCVTEHGGHARALAREALGRGASPIVVWGGDGTINEVGSEVAFRDAALGIVPSGSGNGLARALSIPFDPHAAFAVAFAGRERVIDAGEIDGRLFFNVAGLGIDARVAHEFAAHGLMRRGFRRYLAIAARELVSFRPDDRTIIADGVRTETRAMLVALANGPQYGNGARIAPHAALDDGRLDLVVVEHRSLLATIAHVPFLFAGRIDRVPGVRTQKTSEIEIASPGPVVYHVDGEPFAGGVSLKGRVRPGALRVRVR